MQNWIKITIGITASLIILIAAGGYIFYKMLTSSLPVYEGEIYSASIKNEIKIYRDSLAIPYIIAENDEDVAFALGYIHAQERLFSMDIARRAAVGRLSEIFGDETVPFDKMFLTIGIKHVAEENLKRASPEVINILQAYADGVNDYITGFKGKYPVEFDVLGYDPYKWEPVHSLLIVRMIAWELNLSWWTDITFSRLVRQLGEEKVKEILPAYPENAPYIIPEGIKNFSMIEKTLIETDKAFRKFIGIDGSHLGSNNWIVNDSLSASGKPIIANDPHLAYSMPGKWYAAVIRSKNWNAEGVTLPGVPGIVIGKNRNLSWAVTNIMADDADFYMEKIDSTGKKYFYDGRWNDLVISKDTIKIKDGIEIPFVIKKTHRGPLISLTHPYSVLHPEQYFENTNISMRWSGNDPSDEMNSYLSINKSKNWDEFKIAVSGFSVPGQNFIYGDGDGNIGYIFGGRLPLRNKNNPTFVFDGTKSDDDWLGYIAKSELPSFKNPNENFIATANNKTAKDYKHHISNLWEPSSRIERINTLLHSKKKHSAADFKIYQNDIVSPYAKEITTYILEAFSGIKINDDNLNQALLLFENWDFEFGEFSQTPAIYAMFFNYLMSNIFQDEMGEDLFNEFVMVANVPYRSVRQILDLPDCSWFDDVSTSEVETKNIIIRKSLADALTELEKIFGKNINAWQWGKLHQFKFKHPFSGYSGLIDEFINAGSVGIGGDGTTILNTEYPFSKSYNELPGFSHDPFENILGPSMRFIYDFANPEEFYLILNTGQSGNIMSQHYNDMVQAWHRGRYIKILTDEVSIKSPEHKLLRILPLK